MYKERRSDTFNRKVNEAYRQLRDQIEDKIGLILQAPRSAAKSEPLKWKLSGKRSAHLNKSIRIIYTICEECHQQGAEGRNRMECPDCLDVPLQTVNFLDIVNYHR